VGFFDRFMPKSKREGRVAREARQRELAGDLGGAVTLYTQAGLADEAARVLLLRADAEPAGEKRMAFCALAAEAARSEDLRRKARGRKALLAFDMLRGRGGALLANEVLAVARELEDAGELERAADAYAMGGDPEGEVRALTAAGAIEKLEDRLHASERKTRSDRRLELALRRVTDLDRVAERREALAVARVSLAESDDPRLSDAARSIRARILRGPVVDLEIDGRGARYALGAEVTIGRGDATIVIASRSVSRRHMRLAAGADGAFVEDLGTRNGTTLAGARLDGPVPVGTGVSVMLGGEVPVVVKPAAAGGFTIDVADAHYVAPLGDLEVDGWRIVPEGPADDPFVVLRTPEGAEPPFMGGFQLAARVELCHGDEIRASRGGPVRLRVPATRAGADDETRPGDDFLP
jgi:hypothetical protein